MEKGLDTGADNPPLSRRSFLALAGTAAASAGLAAARLPVAPALAEEGGAASQDVPDAHASDSWYARFAAMVSAGGYDVDESAGGVGVGYTCSPSVSDVYLTPSEFGYDYANVAFCLYDIDADGTPELLVYNGFNGLAAFYVFAYAGGGVAFCGTAASQCSGVAGHAGLLQMLDYLGSDLSDYPEYAGVYDEVIRTRVITLEDGVVVSRDVSMVGRPAMGGSGQVVLFETDDAELLALAQAERVPLDFVPLADVQAMGWDAFVESQGFDSGNEGAVRELTVSFDDGDDGEQVERTISWGWDLFDRSANAYSHDLAWAALYLAEGAYHGADGSQAHLADLGFTSPASFFYEGDDEGDDEALAPAVTFGSAKATVGGQERFIVAAAVRGTNSANPRDLTIDLLGEVANGYYDAACTVRDALQEHLAMLAGHYGTRLTSENTVLFVAGHSLGGAVAGYLGRLLSGNPVPQQRVFAYTFASPKYRLYSAAERVAGTLGGQPPSGMLYDNVHNVVNKADGVPMADVGAGFGRYGFDWCYDMNVERYGGAISIGGVTLAEEGWLDWNVGVFNANHATRTYRACLESGLPELE